MYGGIKLREIEAINHQKRLEQEAKEAKSRLEAERATLKLTETEFEQQCEELFSEPPIPFDARKGNVLETRMQQILQIEKVMIPVIWIKNDLYLVGSQKATCQLKSGNILIRQGASFELFD